MGSIYYKFPSSGRRSPPSTPSLSVSGSSIFERRTSNVEPDDAGSQRTSVTEGDRSGSPTPSTASMPRPGPPRGKRKRLSKACDSCHKSKRRCDGTAPCANCDFAGKQCIYTDANGRVVPPPRTRDETEDEHTHHNRPRRHSVSVAHLMIGQHAPYVGGEGGPPFATRPPSPAPERIPGLPIPGAHHLRPEQPPRPFATPISPAPPPTWDHYYHHHHPYPLYKRAHDPPDERRYDAPRGLYQSLKIVSPRTSSGRLSGDKNALDLDPHLVHELVHLFFANQHPAHLMLHRPSFLSALGRGQVPMPLLNSILALAAPFSAHPALRTNPPWHAGERFAQAASAELFDQNGQLALRPDLAAAQALCLLMLHECVIRRPTQTDRQMCIAFQIMKDLGVSAMDDPATPSLSSEQSYDHWISAECHRRTFWVLYVVESLSSAFASRPMTFKESQLKVRLPVDQASFELGIQKDTVPEYLQFPMPTQMSSTAELGQLVRVTWIYTSVMNQIVEISKKGRPPGPGDPVTAETIAYSEQCLHSWEASLPERLRFNQEMLQVHMRTAENGASVGGWTYAYMHALAECSALGLQELLEVMPNREAARVHSIRQQRALDNLLAILASLGPRGRRSMWTGTLLLAVVRYRAAMTPHSDAHVSEWCAEFEKQWGISLGELVSVEFRRSWCASTTTNRGPDAESIANEAPSASQESTQPTPRPRSPVPTYQMPPASQVTLPPLQSFGLLHVGNENNPNSAMLPPPVFGQDRRTAMPRGLPWLEDELKSGQGDASKGGR